MINIIFFFIILGNNTGFLNHLKTNYLYIHGIKTNTTNKRTVESKAVDSVVGLASNNLCSKVLTSCVTIFL